MVKRHPDACEVSAYSEVRVSKTRGHILHRGSSETPAFHRRRLLPIVMSPVRRAQPLGPREQGAQHACSAVSQELSTHDRAQRRADTPSIQHNACSHVRNAEDTVEGADATYQDMAMTVEKMASTAEVLGNRDRTARHNKLAQLRNQR